jgi:hypothetical protein
VVKVGDLVRSKRGLWSGIIIGEEYVRHHQYLDRELYFKILISSQKGTYVKSVFSEECEAIETKKQDAKE